MIYNARLVLGLLVGLASLVNVRSITYGTPGATITASDYTTWDKFSVKGSRKAIIDYNFVAADGDADYVKLIRLDLVGDAAARGFAAGALLHKEIVEFTGPKMTKYFADYVLNIDISGVPEPLQSILRILQIKGAIAAPTVFHEAMTWVWNQEEKYVPAAIKEEISAMAEGMCSVMGSSCDVAEWTAKIQQFNMLPELIRMACTAYGAWGPATPDNTLVQLRALDFGSGPFSNYTIISVYRGDPDNSNAFVSVTFPGFVGAITGVSSSGIGISEKVWMTYDTPDLLPGSYDGLADIFVLREILENSKSKADAEEYIANANRTWAMWVGIGDYATMTFDLVGYQQPSSVVYTDVTMPSMTGQPYLESVCYVDKHPQPSGDGPTGSLPSALADFYGNITQETSKTIIQYHQTGDQHIASYDFGAKTMYVAIGRINHDGDYGPEGGDLNSWKAYQRPYMKFSLTELWEGK